MDKMDWDQCVVYLKAKLPYQDYVSWIQPLQVRIKDQETFLEVVIFAPNRFVANKVESDYQSMIYQFFESKINKALKFSISIGSLDEDWTLISEQNVNQNMFNAAAPAERNVLSSGKKKAPISSFEVDCLRVDPMLSFKNFVKGPSNELALASAKRLVSSSDRIHIGNPLVLYGASGLGKTHLLHAIANSLNTKKRSFRCVFLSSEQFYRQMVRAIQNRDKGHIEKFNHFFSDLDLLMIDDVHFLAGKKHSQDEFMYIYNRMIDRGAHIVLTADRYPQEIQNLEPRLKTRFSSGLTIPVESPDFMTRVKILIKKAKLFDYHLTQDCAEIIAKHIKSNVRELEGALKLVVAHADFKGVLITEGLIYEALRDLLENKERQLSVGNIKQIVATYFQIKVADMISRNRSKNIVYPRQMAITLTKEHTDYSLAEIGRAFGNRNHATMLYAIKRIVELKKNKEVAFDYKQLTRQLLM